METDLLTPAFCLQVQPGWNGLADPSSNMPALQAFLAIQGGWDSAFSCYLLMQVSSGCLCSKGTSSEAGMKGTGPFCIQALVYSSAGSGLQG